MRLNAVAFVGADGQVIDADERDTRVHQELRAGSVNGDKVGFEIEMMPARIRVTGLQNDALAWLNAFVLEVVFADYGCGGQVNEARPADADIQWKSFNAVASGDEVAGRIHVRAGVGGVAAEGNVGVGTLVDVGNALEAGLGIAGPVHHTALQGDGDVDPSVLRLFHGVFIEFSFAGVQAGVP